MFEISCENSAQTKIRTIKNKKTNIAEGTLNIFVLKRGERIKYAHDEITSNNDILDPESNSPKTITTKRNT